MPPAPAALASDWQYWSAPANPPKSAPLPGFLLVTKKLIGLAEALLELENGLDMLEHAATRAADVARARTRADRRMGIPSSLGTRRLVHRRARWGREAP
ncbi:hypothetical protein GCM10028796_31950 [Ramlibacter monticola]